MLTVKYFLTICLFYCLAIKIYTKPITTSYRYRRAINSRVSIESCNSLVYCQGRLLDTIQRARIFNDSKTFVDLNQINSEDVTLENFNRFMEENGNNPTDEQIADFVRRNFEDSSDLDLWTPTDFNPNPSFLDGIRDDKIKQFAKNIVAIWPTLGRKIKPSVRDNPDKHSIIYVPNGIIIPGGRFKEIYYWDTYWIVKGLLISEMYDTAKGVIENLLSLVDRYGFIPNGGRVYYLNRSHPPLLTHMVALYLEKKQDKEWLKRNIKLLEKELYYWLNEKTVQVEKNGNTYTMAHYISQSNTPRPESYIEDINTCNYFTNQQEKEHCYQGLKSGAESGWDFSSRWFFDKHGNSNTNLTHIDAQRVIPVDLNAFLCSAFLKLSGFYNLIGDNQNALKWKQKSQLWEDSIEQLLYDKEDGIWYDYDPELSKPRKQFYPSNFAPLWTESYNLQFKRAYGQRAANYFTNLKIDDYKGGIPSSLDNNGEQWDFPNAWAPLQEFIILGLYNTRNHKARRIANESAKNWIEANLKGYNEQGAMFEKYDAVREGQYGGGGEYEVQKGFGWTNGVALNLIQMFYTRRRESREEED